MYTYLLDGQWVIIQSVPDSLVLNGVTQTGLQSKSNPELAALGLHQIAISMPAFDPQTQTVIDGPIVWHGDVPVMTKRVARLDGTPISANRILTKLAFLDRFTAGELDAIYTAAQSNVQVQVWLDKYRISDEINLDDQRLIDGVNGLEAAGAVGTGRAAQILA